MFQAHAHGDAFGLDGDVLVVKIAVHVAGGMACGQNDGSGDLLSAGGAHTANGAAFHEQGVHACLEAHLPARVENLCAHGLDDTGQTVGADVGMGIAEDVGGGAVLTEDAENLFHVAALLGARIEFSVRIGSCSALAERVVAFGVYDVLAGDAGNVLAARVYVLAAFEHNGAQAQLDEAQGGEEAARSGAYHHYLRAARHVGIAHRGEVGARRFFAEVQV